LPFSFFKVRKQIKPMRLGVIFLLLFFTSLSFAQTTLRQAQSRMEKGRWSEAKELLTKTRKKEGPNTELSAAWAQWFFSKGNPSYQVDSAYHYCQLAILQLQQLEGKSKDRLLRIGFDSTQLILYRERIDSTAFAETKEVNTEKGYESFMQRFPDSKQRSTAAELRDEVSFLDALKTNSYQSFEQYFRLHPTSHRAPEAKTRYEKLLFDSKTKDRKFKSYVSFIRDFPNSPFRDLADRQIFEISTARGDTSSFLQFLHDFPTNKWNATAIDWLFHLYIEYERSIPNAFLNDSLRKVIRLNESYWVPIQENGKFGFINSAGEQTLAPRFESIDERYLCGSVFDDVLFTNEGLISRGGKLISSRSSIQQSLGFGFYKIGDSSCVKVVHKSGQWVIKDCLQEVKLLGAHFLAVKQKGRWRLATLTGRPLLGASTWESIEWVEGVFVLSRLGKKIVMSLNSIELTADGSLLSDELVFDDVSRVGVDRLLVRNGSLEGLINSKLEFVVPLGRQTLTVRPFGLIRKVNDQYSVADLAKELDGQWWDNIILSKQWLLLKRGVSQQLFDLKSKRIIGISDSCWFAGGLAFAKYTDSVRVFFNSLSTLTFSTENRLHFIKSRDSVRFFYTELKSKKAVYDIATGQRLFTQEFESIESFRESVFLISSKGKKGLISKAGKLALPVEYEAIVPLKDDYWSIYKDKKFGLFDWKRKRLVKPIYSRNISMLNNDVLIVYKDEHFGLTNWNGKALTAFEFDEMQPWTDDLVWCKQNGQWSLMNVRSGRVEVDHIKDFQMIANTPTEKSMLIRRDNLYGVISYKKGIVIPTSFNSINNVGTDEHPLYFTVKEVKEAQIYVVIYYDQLGKRIRKQVYEESDFEKIVCDD
jgi:hypothetical protein